MVGMKIENILKNNITYIVGLQVAELFWVEFSLRLENMFISLYICDVALGHNFCAFDLCNFSQQRYSRKCI